MNDRCDIAIIGGGPIGCALAAALRGGGFQCVVLEARSGRSAAADGRTLALSFASRLILERIGAWSAIDPVTPIVGIHVSQQGAFGRALLQAADVGLEALGYVMPFAALHEALFAVLDRSGVEVRFGTRVTRLAPALDAVCVHCSSDEGEVVLRARLAVIADGATSLGQQAGAGFCMRDYAQAAVVGMVQSASAHGNRAYERFTPHGPVALLPSSDEFALVWTCRPEAAPHLISLSDGQFLVMLQQHFGDRAGRFVSVRSRAAFALSLRFARRIVRDRIVLLGNSAQMLHPIAGQGFNLGLRDTWELARLLRRGAVSDPGIPALLARYGRSRRIDRIAGITATDLLTRIFSNDFPVIEQARGLGIALLDLLPPARRFLMRRMIFGTAA
ncbi:MAG TPA: FAD-dependent monooxygenase [Burkholderiales bacterium]|jgi:2-octaprenyl-6-methoxyphenol hydroxylase|nr:FAD-dependent monooxygenase [Burkholderiales bacterium]